MDYKAIYDRFIQSRRETPPGESEYFERHHIVPRCMNGSDDTENIIPLIPEDHFFAHLCLAKAYKSRSLWAAVWVMVHDGKHDGKNKSWATLRKRYGFLQRRRPVGINHPMADLQEYTFYHIDGSVFKGTRIAFGEKYDIPLGSVNSLFRGQLQCYQWSLKKLTKERLKAATVERAKKNGKKLKGYVRDKAEYRLYNIKTGQSFCGKQSDIYPNILSKSSTSAICLESRLLTRCGWCLEKNKETAYRHACKPGELNTRFNKKRFDFRHVSGKTEKNITAWGMGQKHSNGDSRGFGAVASGQRNGYKGWHIDGRAKPIILNANYTVISQDGELFTGTLREISEKIGAHYQTVSRAFRGEPRPVKGWSLVT